MRKYYLDHLRTITILLLFPVHTFMIWNNFQYSFYIWVNDNNLLSTLIVAVNPIMMPLLFVIAGICAKYSLQRRTMKQFVKERCSKLLLPFLYSLILFVPIQAYYARKYFFAYEGSLIDHYGYFFTHFTDFSGYDGCFTPSHLWFLLYLFLISMAALLIFRIFDEQKVQSFVSRLSLPMIIGMAILVWLSYYIGNIGSYSIGKYFVLYLLGYYILTQESIMEKLMKHQKLIALLFIFFETLLIVSYYLYSYYGDFLVNLVGWLGCLLCITAAKCFLNKKTFFTNYFNNASFFIYIMHQPILIILAYYTVNIIDNIFLQICVILFGSLLITLLLYEIVTHIRCLFHTIQTNPK